MTPTRASPPVHPRVCGERVDAMGAPVAYYGSSPRVRGTGLLYRDSVFQRRFIPACAGNGPAGPPLPEVDPVHPRVCGERSTARPRRMAGSGSSPRVRGTVFFSLIVNTIYRFIPACAGNGPR